MIISENETQYLIDIKDYQVLIKKIGILEFDDSKIKRWIDSKKIDGVYEKGEIYKDRLSIISGILSKGV